MAGSRRKVTNDPEAIWSVSGGFSSEAYNPSDQHRVTLFPSSFPSCKSFLKASAHLTLRDLGNKRIEGRVSKRCLCSHFPSSIIHKGEGVRQPKGPPMDERINAVLSIHALEHDPASGRKGP